MRISDWSSDVCSSDLWASWPRSRSRARQLWRKGITEIMAAAMDIAALASIWEFTALFMAMAATATEIHITATMPAAAIIATAAIIMMTIVETAGLIGVSRVINAGRIERTRVGEGERGVLRGNV